MKMITRTSIIPKSRSIGWIKTSLAHLNDEYYEKSRRTYFRSTLWEMNIKYSNGVRTSIGEI